MSKSNLNDVASLFEHVKAIEYTFARRDSVIAEFHPHSVRTALAAVHSSTLIIRQKTVGIAGNFPPRCYRDFLSALTAIEHLALTSEVLSYPRQSVLVLAAEVVNGFAATASGTSQGGAGGRTSLEKECLNLHALVVRASALSNIARFVRSLFVCRLVCFVRRLTSVFLLSPPHTPSPLFPFSP